MDQVPKVIIENHDRVQWETLVTSIVAVLIALGGLFQNNILGVLFRSKLVFSKKHHKVTHSHGDTTYFRLLIFNSGRVAAKNVEAYVTDVECNGTILNILPSPLEWTHHPSRIIRDIQRHQPAQLDLIRFWHDQKYTQIRLEDEVCKYPVGAPKPIVSLLSPPIMDQLDLSSLIPGESILTIKLYQQSGDIVTCNVTVLWDGIDEPEIINIK